MKHQLTAIFAASILTAAMAADTCLADERVLVKDGKANCAIVLGSKSTVPERNICKVLQARIRKRTGCLVPIVEEKNASQAISVGNVAIMVGTISDNDLSRRLCEQADRLVPSTETVGPGGFVIHTLERDGKTWIVLAGSDARGTVCAVGKFFRKMDFSDAGAAVAPLVIVDKIDPIEVMYLQQQKPAQWDNAFMDAPVEKIRGYTEDLAMWGSDSFLTLCNWGINNPFKEDADARSKEKMKRIMGLLAYARSLGMDIGYFDYPNCVYDDQVHLQKLGGKFRYPRDVCPSIPEVRKVLLENRENLYRTAKETGIKFDFLCHTAHDFGGCDCEKCKPWMQTWLKLSKDVHRIAAKYHPSAKFYLHTWGCSGEERRMLFDYIHNEKPKKWVAGVLDTKGGVLPAGYRTVAYITIQAYGPALSYGKRGANPLPLFLPERIRKFHKRGIREMQTYSEGIYDDINNAIVAQVCRHPFRKDIPDILKEYCHSNFGTSDEDSITLADLILTKFKHHGEGHYVSVHVEDPGQVLAAMEKIEKRMPQWGKDDWRWGILKTRVQLEDLHEKARAHDTWVQHLDAILAGPASQGDDAALVNALARAKTYLTDLEVSFEQMEKECVRLTHHLYHELYGTPNRHAAHGSFRLRLPPKRNLVPELQDRCEMLTEEPDAAKRTKGVATLLKRL